MNEAYFQDYYKINERQYEAIKKLTEGLSPNTYKLFCHILVCTLYKLKSFNGYTPVSSDLIKKKARGASWKELEDKKLIKATGYWYNRNGTGESREFTVPSEILHFLVSLPYTYKDKKVNLFNGHPVKKASKSFILDKTKHSEPELIRAATEQLWVNKCRYELEPVLDHINLLEKEFNIAQVRYDKEPIELNEIALRKAEGRYLNDKFCYRAVLNQEPEYIGKGFYEFKPDYKVLSTGRIQMKGGGLQNCSRKMKAKAYSNIPNLYNYDLRASQATICIQLLEEAGFDGSWLQTYIDTPNQKHIYAERAGLSVDTWKPCMLALLMGAGLPKSIDGYYEDSKSEIRDLLYMEANGNTDKTRQLIKSFGAVVKPLKTELDKWHEWLTNTYIPETMYVGGRERKRYIKNRADKRYCLDPKDKKGKDVVKGKWKLQSEVSAFLLQGLESCFIHHLTILGSKYNYQAMANEHDGLITIGQIPELAIAEAKDLSGLKYVALDIKSFT